LLYKGEELCFLEREEKMKYVRLKKQSDFQKLFQKGKRAFSPSLTLVYYHSEKTTMGISVGKRHGKSLQRNRIKRLIREAFRLNQDKMQGTYSFIILPKVREEYSFKTFERDLQCMIQKEKL
jgi:ribonuclease P protein component